jgi:bifunctional DNA-binding transcriptional regulator/antitoxin component of YhaV-PrlF toxin-antitoxin module
MVRMLDGSRPEVKPVSPQTTLKDEAKITHRFINECAFRISESVIFCISDMLKESIQETTKMGKRGTIVIPSALRRRYGLADGSLVIAEAREDGLLLRLATAIPIEIYTPERKAEFLLSNAIDEKDYQAVKENMRPLGVNPSRIKHFRPRRIK